MILAQLFRLPLSLIEVALFSSQLLRFVLKNMRNCLTYAILTIFVILVYHFISNFFRMTTTFQDSVVTYESIKLDASTLKFAPKRQDLHLNFKQFFTLLQQENEFLEKFIQVLQNISFEGKTNFFLNFSFFFFYFFLGYYFECPPVNSNNFDQKTFEFVIVKSETLQFRPVEKEDFQDYFTEEKSAAVTFENLGKDAVLVAPNPLMTESKLEIYSHLGSFMRKASDNQLKGFWKIVADNFIEEIQRKSRQNIWLSTAGDGVAWLHIRMDTRPKYYHYLNYKVLNLFS